MIWRALLLGALGFYLSVLGFMYARQTQLQFPADTRPDRLADVQVAHGGLAGFVEIGLHTQDGLDLHAWYLKAPKGRPTILFLHGNTNNLNGTVGHIARLASMGYGVLALEYRGYGGNPGTPSGQGLALDADAALAFLAGGGIAAERIVLYGHSLGTGVATALAARSKVGALILDCPFTSSAAVGQQRYPYLPVRLLLRSPMPVEGLLKDVHVPILIMQGARDRTVPPSMGQAVYRAANTPKAFWSAPDAGHGQVLEQGGVAVAQDFIRTYIGGA